MPEQIDLLKREWH